MCVCVIFVVLTIAVIIAAVTVSVAIVLLCCCCVCVVGCLVGGYCLISKGKIGTIKKQTDSSGTPTISYTHVQQASSNTTNLEEPVPPPFAPAQPSAPPTAPPQATVPHSNYSAPSFAQAAPPQSYALSDHCTVHPPDSQYPHPLTAHDYVPGAATPYPSEVVAYPSMPHNPETVLYPPNTENI